MISTEKKYRDCKNNLSTTYHNVGLIRCKNLQLVLLPLQLSLKECLLRKITNLALFEFRSNLCGVLKPLIKKFPLGKLLSIFVSEIINTSMLPLV